MLPGGGYVWYDIADITPSRERPLDEVKDQVEARWKQDEIIKRLDAKTTEIVDKLKSGTSMADVAAANGVMVQTKSGLKRETADNLPPRLLSQVFRTAKDAVGSSEGQTATDRIIFQVTDIKVPTFDPSSAIAKTVSDQLRGAYNEELMSQYVSRLENEIGVDINQSALAQAVGRTSN
jgi:peptidyl-prolyl cis-trans isomerase D